MNGLLGRALLAAVVFAPLGGEVVALGDGFFQVEQRQGAWWFIDPAGEKFFSLGVNVLQPGPEKVHYKSARPRYAAWRYYADDEAWAHATLSRLRSWNFNTIGAWHVERLRTPEWPYTEVLHIGAESGVPWNDLFSESFANEAEQFAAKHVAPHRDDAQLVGWFTDNELGWYSDALFFFHLRQSAESKTRQRLVQLLREHYQGDFAKLKQDFRPTANVDSFETLASGGRLKLVPGSDGPKVIAEFAELAADRYYSVVCGAIRRHDPNHLILGDRYPGYCPDPVVRAAGRRLDVISTNYDWPWGVDGYLPRSYLRRLHELTGKPVMVTEYYSAAQENQSGNPNSGDLFVVTADQASRAEVARRRLEIFADEPYVVGAHWFAFADEPPQGRASDGEDYNFGLVDIHNNPYDILTAGITKWHIDAVKRHANSGARRPPRNDAPVNLAQLDRQATVETIGNSLDSQTVIPPRDDSAPADFTAAWDGKQLYLTLAGNHFVEMPSYAELPRPFSDGQTWKVTLQREGKTQSFELHMLDDLCVPNHPAINYRYWRRGVRYIATAVAPARLLDTDQWKTGDRLGIRAELCDNREDCCAQWSVEAILTDGPGKGPRVLEAASVAGESN